MKRFIKYILIAFAAVSMYGCISKESFILNEPVEEGLPVTLNLDFVSMSNDISEVATKGGDNHDINDLYVFIFSSENGRPGVLKSKHYETGPQKTNTEISNDKGTSSNTISTKVTTSIETTTGESFIFAFANISSSYAPAEYNVASLKNQLDALEIGTECYEGLMNVAIPLRTADFTSLQRVTDSYLMAGTYQKNDEYTRANTPCVIDQSGTLNGGTIRMYRLDARVDFRIISDTSSESKGTFVPTAWRLYNVPKKSRLMTTAYGTGEDFDGKSPEYTSDEAVAENYWNTNDMKIDAEGSNYVFSFYMFENRKSPTSEGAALSQWKYRHRETMNPLLNADGTASTEGDLHSFKYAPEYATYVEIDGYFTGTTKYPFGSPKPDGKDHLISATSQYRIHLGDFGSNVNGRTYDDFNTLRNYHYTYTITVKGVDQIIVEVNKAGEKLEDMETPGINGMVSYIPSNSHRVDSHYETRSIRIKRSDLDNWDEEDFKYLAQTCYGDYEGPKGTGSPRHDIYWVEFVLTHKLGKNGGWWSWYNSTDTGQSYSSLPTAGRTERHPAYMSYYYATTWSSKSQEEVKLMYVNEFLQSLWEWKNAPEDASDNVHSNIVEKVYTVYIKENYYSNSDIAKFDRQKNATGESDSGHWKDFCNKPERVMYVGMNKIESGETESAIMQNVCVARQRSIQTVYNTDHEHTGLTSAWGVETIDEMAGTITQFDRNYYVDDKDDENPENDEYIGVTKIPTEIPGPGTDFETPEDVYYNRDNGYKAQIFFMANGWRIYTTGEYDDKPETHWARYVDQTTHDDMAADTDGKHYFSFLECLSRNRDENGNGLIEANELKWYLPAVNQFGDLFIGERGLDPEATLTYGNTWWSGDIPYLTSSFMSHPSSNKPVGQYKVLAIEGFAYSDNEAGIGDFIVRCARNMGQNGGTNYSQGVASYEDVMSASYKEPQNYVQINESSRIMDLTYLNDESKRSFVNTELTAEHTEHSDENQLYQKFQWADRLVSASHQYYRGDTPSDYMFSADEVAYGERNNPSMRTLTRASLYPYDKLNTYQTASDSPQWGWRAPNQKELMLLHFHADGFRAGTVHYGSYADGGSTTGYVYNYDGNRWFFCRTCFSYGGVKANRSWRNYGNNWVTDPTVVLNDQNTSIVNEGNWYRYDNTNQYPDSNTNLFYNDYRYAFAIMHDGTGFGLLCLDYYMHGNALSKQSYLVPVRDVN